MSLDAVIVGNGVAGYACATRLARSGKRPLLVGPGLPFDRPPFTKAALARSDAQPLATAARLVEQGIELLDGLAEQVDLLERRVYVRHGSDLIAVEAPSVVLAVGLSYSAPPVPGLEAGHVHATPMGFRRLVDSLAGGKKRVVIVGAGLIGVETAATLARLGHEVTLLDLEARPLHRLHDPLPDLAWRSLCSLGVAFRGEATIAFGSPSNGGQLTHLGLEGGGGFDADVVVAATGGRQPMTKLRPALVLPIGVDTSMRIPGFEGVYAIGDCAMPLHARFGEMRFPHWDAAHGTAERAADEIAGVPGVYQRLPYWWSEIGELRVAEVGYAAAVAQWAEEDGLHIGRDRDGLVVCVLVVGSRSRLQEARQLVESHAETTHEAVVKAPRVEFERDIRPLFREEDRAAMDYVFDLWSYDDVRDWAPRILERIEDETMPCDAVWAPDKLDLLRGWIDSGCIP